MKINWYWSIFLFLNFFASCTGKKCEFSDIELNKFDALSLSLSPPDSVIILFPSLACSECLISSKNIIKRFHTNKSIKLVIVPNGSPRDSNIIYFNELATISNLELDSVGFYTSFVENDPTYIWMYVYIENCQFKIKVEGGIEDEIVRYLEGI